MSSHPWTPWKHLLNTQMWLLSSLWGCGGRTAGNHPSFLHQDMEELAVQHQVDCPYFWLRQNACIWTVLWGGTIAVCVVVTGVTCVKLHYSEDEWALVSTYGLSTMYLCLLHSDWCISRQLWWGHQIPAYQVNLPNSTDKQEVGSVDICMF